jgi:uncharacterized protein (TIGR02145 family)
MKQPMKSLLIFITVSFTLFIKVDSTISQVTDIDNNVYKTVIIGGNEWTSENLNVSHYRNGDVIPQVQDKEEWKNLTTGAWCYYNNDSTMGTIYGKLYNFYALNDKRGRAPEGWHIPTDSEWTQAENFLGEYFIAGGKMKSLTLWESPNKGATNEIDFAALPSGLRYDNGEFNFLNEFCYFWSSTEFDSNTALARLMSYKNTVIFRFNNYMKDGYAVRCVKNY